MSVTVAPFVQGARKEIDALFKQRSINSAEVAARHAVLDHVVAGQSAILRYEVSWDNYLKQKLSVPIYRHTERQAKAAAMKVLVDCGCPVENANFLHEVKLASGPLDVYWAFRERSMCLPAGCLKPGMPVAHGGRLGLLVDVYDRGLLVWFIADDEFAVCHPVSSARIFDSAGSLKYASSDLFSLTSSLAQ